jgi:hypothetical protein
LFNNKDRDLQQTESLAVLRILASVKEKGVEGRPKMMKKRETYTRIGRGRYN